MTTAVETIMQSLAEVFVGLDIDVLENSQLWAKGRVAALQEFKASDEYKALRRDQFRLYEKMFAIAGGKTWYRLFNYNSDAGIAEFVAKNCAATAASRNASIANKLNKAGVTEVVETIYTHSHDGFNGTFIVMANTGKKVVTINTIVAGGYNIQCRHLRTLVKVR